MKVDADAVINNKAKATVKMLFLKERSNYDKLRNVKGKNNKSESQFK